MVEQRTVGTSATGLDGVAADKFVDVFKACVFAHVDHCVAVFGHGHCGTFVRGAAHGGALFGRGAGVGGVDFHDPAKAVGLVGVFHRVKAGDVFVPAVATAAAFLQAPALFVGAQGVAATEVVDEVFFGRQVSAPRRDATGAVVERAQHAATRRVGSGFDQGVASDRPTDFARGVGGNAARPGRGLDHFPFATFVFDFEHGHAVGGLGFAHFLRRPGDHSVREQQALVGVFVVDDQQAALGAVLGKVVHAVVVHADLGFLVRGGVAGVVLEGVVFAGQAHGRTPGRNHLHRVAFGHDHGVGQGNSHTLEAEQGSARATAGSASCQRRSTTHRAQRRQEAAGQSTQTAPQNRAARRGGYIMNTGVGGAVAVLHGGEVFCHGVFLQKGGGIWCRATGATGRGVPFLRVKTVTVLRFSRRKSAPHPPCFGRAGTMRASANQAGRAAAAASLAANPARRVHKHLPFLNNTQKPWPAPASLP